MNKTEKAQEEMYENIKAWDTIMSWDMPIEQEILRFVTSMERRMGREGISATEKRVAEGYANAYKTVKEHIKKEMNLRAKLKETK
jgi:GTP cyclohydrolase I